MSILVVGSIAYDSVETPNAKVEDALGGSTLFFSAAASLSFKDKATVNTIYRKVVIRHQFIDTGGNILSSR